MSNDKLAATGYVEQYVEERKLSRPTVAVEQDPAYGVSTPWQPQAREGQDVADLDIKEWVGQALGAASACWSDLEGAGVFDSTRCAAIADALNKHIMSLMVAMVEEGQQRLRVQERYLHSLYEGSLVHGCSWCGAMFGAGDEGQTKARLHVQTHHAQPCKREQNVVVPHEDDFE